MEKESKFLFLCVLIFIFSLIAFASVFISKQSYLDKKAFFTGFEVSDKAGFDVNQTALTFGRLISDSSSTRNLIFTNDYNFPVEISFEVEGNISPFLKFEKKVIVEEKETKKIGITAFSFKDMKKGNYTGELTAITRKLG